MDFSEQINPQHRTQKLQAVDPLRKDLDLLAAFGRLIRVLWQLAIFFVFVSRPAERPFSSFYSSVFNLLN